MPGEPRSHDDDTLLTAALSYAERGWQVLPGHNPSKGNGGEPRRA